MPDMSEMADRVGVAKRLGMHPQVSGDIEFSRLEEGVHYEVVAYTDWCDQFVPTVVCWHHTGDVDWLDDPEASIAHARSAVEVKANAE